MAGKIFISYRRDDAKAEARSIYQWLQKGFRGRVFMDVDAIQKGRDFLRVLDEHLAQCAVMLVIMGPRWADASGVQRLQDENDLVRVEVAAALKRDIPVIPVLVDGAKMPVASVLPEDLKPIVRRHGAIITHENFARDMGGLAHDIEYAIGSSIRWLVRKLLPAGVVLAALTVAAMGLVALMQLDDATVTFTADKDEIRLTRVRKAKPPDSIETSASKEPQKTEAKALSPTRLAKPLTQAEERGLKPKDTFKECPECPEMVVVPVGEIMIGSPEGEEGRKKDEGPQHKVTIGQPFAVGKFEVTFAEWDACVAEGGCANKPKDEGWGRGKRPVINVNWDEITAQYLPWLSRRTGQNYRLLSEPEWEYAARAGSTWPFATGRTITTAQANFDGLYTYGGSAKGVYRGKTVEVGSFPANAFGLHDLHGNVWEFVDACEVLLPATTFDTLDKFRSGTCDRVLRGGAWSSSPAYLRSANRSKEKTVARDYCCGFRVARSLNR